MLSTSRRTTKSGTAPTLRTTVRGHGTDCVPVGERQRFHLWNTTLLQAVRVAGATAHDLFITSDNQDEPFVMSTMREYETDPEGKRQYHYRVIIWLKTVRDRRHRGRRMSVPVPTGTRRDPPLPWIRNDQGKEQHVLDVSEDTVLTAGQVLAAVTPTLATKKASKAPGAGHADGPLAPMSNLAKGPLRGWRRTAGRSCPAQAVALEAGLARVQRGGQTPPDDRARAARASLQGWRDLHEARADDRL